MAISLGLINSTTPVDTWGETWLGGRGSDVTGKEESLNWTEDLTSKAFSHVTDFFILTFDFDLCLIYGHVECLSCSRHTIAARIGRNSLKLAEDGLGGGNLREVVSIGVSREVRSVSETYLDLLRRSLVLSVADSAILLNDHGPAAVPVAHTSVPAVVLRERSVAHEEGLAVLGAAVDLAPSVHDERIVGSDDDDLVDALGGELLLVLKVGRDVHSLAAGSESAGDGDEDDLLAGELLAGVVGLGEAAGGGAGVGDGSPAVRECVSEVRWVCMDCFHAGCLLELDTRGELLASLDGSHCVDVVGVVGWGVYLGIVVSVWERDGGAMRGGKL